MIFRPLLLVFVLISANIFAQDNSDKIIEFLGTEKYAAYQANNPQYLDQLNAKINFGYKIEIMEDDKINTYNVLEEIIVINPADKSQTSISPLDFVNASKLGDFNILMYSISGNRSFHTYYRLGSTNYVLTIYSIEYILSKI